MRPIPRRAGIGSLNKEAPELAPEASGYRPHALARSRAQRGTTARFQAIPGETAVKFVPLFQQGGGKRRARYRQLPFRQPIQNHQAAEAAAYSTILPGKQRVAIQT